MVVKNRLLARLAASAWRCASVSSSFCRSNTPSRWLKPPISWPTSSWRVTARAFGNWLDCASCASVSTVTSIGANCRLMAHQTSPPANRVRMPVSHAMRCCMATIGAKASSVGNMAEKTQFVTGIRLAEPNTFTPRALTTTSTPSSPPTIRSMSGLTPRAGRASMVRDLSVALITSRCCGDSSKKPPVLP